MLYYQTLKWFMSLQVDLKHPKPPIWLFCGLSFPYLASLASYNLKVKGVRKFLVSMAANLKAKKWH